MRTSGALACWGLDIYGQSTPPAGAFISVSAGGDHTCGVDETGTVACWGLDIYGQATTPGGIFISISSGDQYTCGVRETGAIVCWGVGFYFSYMIEVLPEVLPSLEEALCELDPSRPDCP